jgi:hypothetical protein
MSDAALCLLADALRIWLAEQKYAQETQERIERLEEMGLSFSQTDLVESRQ